MRVKKQTIVWYVLGAAALIMSVVTIKCYFSNLSEHTLPAQVEFKIDNSKIQEKITAQVNPIIAKALKQKQKRSLLLNDIADVLAEYDIIDNYFVRLGFDKKLVIFAHVQTPVLAAHVKNGDIYIIGSAMRIIDKNPTNLVLQNIPNIFLPDAQIKDKNEKLIDYPWFLEQINLINDNVQWYDYKVKKIIWTDSIGFTIKLDNTENNDQMSTEQSHLVVYLGYKDINIKIDKLKIIADALKEKNIKPQQIDLDLIDRAFIK